MKISLLLICSLVVGSLSGFAAEVRHLDSSVSLVLDASHAYKLKVHELQIEGSPHPQFARTVASFELTDSNGKVLYSKTLFPAGEPAINRRGFFDDTLSVQGQVLRSDGAGIALLLSWFPSVTAPDSCSTMIVFSPSEHGLRHLSGEFCGILKFKSETPTEAEMFLDAGRPFFYLVQKAESFEVLLPVRLNKADSKLTTTSVEPCGGSAICEFPIEMYMEPRHRNTAISVTACPRPRADSCRQVRIDPQSAVRFLAASGVNLPATLDGNLQDAPLNTWLKFEVEGESWWTHGYENFSKLGLPGI